MKGLLLIPAALVLALTSGCAGLREDLGIFDGHHREIKHRIDKSEDRIAANDRAIAAQEARIAAAQAAADKAQADAEAARRIAEKALDKNSKK